MIYSELIFIIVTILFSIVIPIFAFIDTQNIEDLFMGFGGSIILMLLLALFMMVFSTLYNNFETTSMIEMTPKYQNETFEGLTILGDDDKVYKFTEYKDVKTLADGGKFYKVYKYKQCFGPDDHIMKVIIK